MTWDSRQERPYTATAADLYVERGFFLAGLGGLKVGSFCVRVWVIPSDKNFTKPCQAL